jgi:Flp pilus assembly protein TadG
MTLLKLKFRALRKEKKGSVTVLAAGVFLLLVMVMGVVIDTILLHSSKVRLQTLADNAVLYAINSNVDRSEIEMNLKDYVADQNLSQKRITNIKTVSLGFEESEKEVSMEVKLQADVDLLFLKDLRNINNVSAFTSAVKGTEAIEVALVLDISSSMRGTRLTEAKAASKAFVEKLLKEEITDERVKISLVPYGGTVRLPYGDNERGSSMGNLLTTPSSGWDSVRFGWIDAVWNRCLELDPEDIHSGLDAAKEYRHTPDYYSWVQTNPWCPIQGNELEPLTTDKDKLLDKIETLTLSDGTGTDHGMAWGYATLTDEWKKVFPKSSDGSSNKKGIKKYIILMSDGGITGQHYIQEHRMTGLPPFRTLKKSRVTRSQSLNAFYGVCDTAKADDVTVYTIGFSIRNARHLSELSSCASSDVHHYASGEGDLEQIFSSLANALSPLRIAS